MQEQYTSYNNITHFRICYFFIYIVKNNMLKPFNIFMLNYGLLIQKISQVFENIYCYLDFIMAVKEL